MTHFCFPGDDRDGSGADETPPLLPLLLLSVEGATSAAAVGADAGAAAASVEDVRPAGEAAGVWLSTSSSSESPLSSNKSLKASSFRDLNNGGRGGKRNRTLGSPRMDDILRLGR